MNKYTQKSGKWIYQPNQSEPFRLSRTRIEMFLDCPRCFYLANRLGLGRPSMPGFSLNTAVDELLKKEFDLLRDSKQTHELSQNQWMGLVEKVSNSLILTALMQKPYMTRWNTRVWGLMRFLQLIKRLLEVKPNAV